MIKLLSDFTALSYQHVLKQIFFLFDAELVHHHMVAMGTMIGQISPLKELTRLFWSYQHPVLVKKIDGITFPNPIGLSAGFDYNGQLTQVLPAVGFGFHTIGTVTLNPEAGNASPRLGRFPDSKALLVNKGFRNNGAKKVIKDLTGLKFEIPVGISIGSGNRVYKNIKERIDEITACFTLFEKSRVKHSYYELNISCPNVVSSDSFISVKNLSQLLKATDKLKIKKPMYVKMPIDQSAKDTLELLNVIDKHHLQGVIFGNLTKDKKNPAVTPADQQKWHTVKGNLSGKPTWARSNAHIALTRKHFKNRFTIIGTGGVFSGADAQVKIAKGADLVQLITGMIFEGPQLIGQINYTLAQNPKNYTS